MFLGELIVALENLEIQIYQLEKFLNRVSDKDLDLVNSATERLLKLLDKHRSYSLAINQVNNGTIVKIDDSEISIATALIIVNALGTKIRILNDIIEKENSLLDIFEIMDKRNTLLAEYTKLSNELKVIQWRVQYNDKEGLGKV